MLQISLPFLQKVPVQEIKSVAVFRALQLGDLLCSVPAFRALRSALPNAQITLVGLPWAKDFAKRFQAYIDDFLPFPGYPGLPEQDINPQEIANFLREIQNKKFDLALQMQGSGTYANELIMLYDAKYQAGFYTEVAYKPHDEFFLYPEGKNEIHIWLNLMQSLGMPSRGDFLEFPLFTEEIKECQIIQKRYSLTPSNYIIFHPGARDIKRRWPAKYFAILADALSERGHKIVITGTQEESDISDEIESSTHYPLINLCGKTNLGVLAALIRDTRLLIANDTGVSHIAAAVQTPSIILFQTANLSRFVPLDKTLHKMMTFAQAEDVISVIQEAKPFLESQIKIKSQNYNFKFES